jgi:hypothetical protein
LNESVLVETPLEIRRKMFDQLRADQRVPERERVRR